jgi:hypothetical protein
LVRARASHIEIEEIITSTTHDAYEAGGSLPGQSAQRTYEA